jgi:two-component system phosphate regulon sensor histidine kinase PhoR
LGLLLSAALLGWASGYTTPALLMAALGILAWQLFHVYRLECWLRHGLPSEPPNSRPLPAGLLWKEIYYRVFRLRQRSRKRKRKLSRIIEQFQTAAAALPDAIVVLSDADKILWHNKASHHLLGLHPTQDIGLSIVSLVRHPSFVNFLNQGTYDNSVEFPSPLGPDLMLSVRIIPYGKKQRLLLAADISRLHRLEQIRRDFVANISHELRTPLTVIGGYLEALLDSEEALAKQWRQPLSRMQQQSSRMLHLIEDLLLLAKLETQTERPPPRPVNVPTMLYAIAEDAVALSGERRHVIKVKADSGLWISGCEQQLRSAFSNLIFNAVRYTPARGHIAIHWFSDEHGLHLQVEDNGEGIPAQHIPRITERFYRPDRGRQREHGGTGLGLAIVKHVVNNHDGQLRISSQVGVGSTFTCDFPTERLIPVQQKLLAIANGTQ